MPEERRSRAAPPRPARRISIAAQAGRASRSKIGVDRPSSAATHALLLERRRLQACTIHWSVMANAVCLLSGGLDSATCLAYARREGFTCYALSFDYGQRHRVELEAAARVAAALGTERHLIMKIGLDAFGGSALTAQIDVPKSRSAQEMGNGIPVTYVPARNTIFLS